MSSWKHRVSLLHYCSVKRCSWIVLPSTNVGSWCILRCGHVRAKRNSCLQIVQLFLREWVYHAQVSPSKHDNHYGWFCKFIRCSSIVWCLQHWKAETHYLRLWTSTIYGAVPCSLSLSTRLRTSTPLPRCCLLQNERTFRQLHCWLVRQHARRHHYRRDKQEATAFSSMTFLHKKEQNG